MNNTLRSFVCTFLLFFFVVSTTFVCAAPRATDEQATEIAKAYSQALQGAGFDQELADGTTSLIKEEAVLRARAKAGSANKKTWDLLAQKVSKLLTGVVTDFVMPEGNHAESTEEVKALKQVLRTQAGELVKALQSPDASPANLLAHQAFKDLETFNKYPAEFLKAQREAKLTGDTTPVPRIVVKNKLTNPRGVELLTQQRTQARLAQQIEELTASKAGKTGVELARIEEQLTRLSTEMDATKAAITTLKEQEGALVKKLTASEKKLQSAARDLAWKLATTPPQEDATSETDDASTTSSSRMSAAPSPDARAPRFNPHEAYGALTKTITARKTEAKKLQDGLNTTSITPERRKLLQKDLAAATREIEDLIKTQDAIEKTGLMPQDTSSTNLDRSPAVSATGSRAASGASSLRSSISRADDTSTMPSTSSSSSVMLPATSRLVSTDNANPFESGTLDEQGDINIYTPEQYAALERLVEFKAKQEFEKQMLAEQKARQFDAAAAEATRDLDPRLFQKGGPLEFLRSASLSSDDKRSLVHDITAAQAVTNASGDDKKTYAQQAAELSDRDAELSKKMLRQALLHLASNPKDVEAIQAAAARLRTANEEADAATLTPPEREKLFSSPSAQRRYSDILAKYRSSDELNGLRARTPVASGLARERESAQANLLNNTRVQKAFQDASTETLKFIIQEHGEKINKISTEIAKTAQPEPEDIAKLAKAVDSREEVLNALRTDPSTYLLSLGQAPETDKTPEKALATSLFKQELEKQLRTTKVEMRADETLEEFAMRNTPAHETNEDTPRTRAFAAMQFMGDVFKTLKSNPIDHATFLAQQRTAIADHAKTIDKLSPSDATALRTKLDAALADPETAKILELAGFDARTVKTLADEAQKPLDLDEAQKPLDLIDFKPKLSAGLKKRLLTRTGKYDSTKAVAEARQRVEEARRKQGLAPKMPPAYPKLKGVTKYIMVDNNGEIYRDGDGKLHIYDERPEGTPAADEHLIEITEIDLNKVTEGKTKLIEHLKDRLNNISAEIDPDLARKIIANADSFLKQLAKKCTRDREARIAHHLKRRTKAENEEQAALAARNSIPMSNPKRLADRDKAQFEQIYKAHRNVMLTAADDDAKIRATTELFNNLQAIPIEPPATILDVLAAVDEKNRQRVGNNEMNTTERDHQRQELLLHLVSTKQGILGWEPQGLGLNAGKAHHTYEDIEHHTGIVLMALDELKKEDQRAEKAKDALRAKFRSHLARHAQRFSELKEEEAKEEAAYALYDSKEEDAAARKLGCRSKLFMLRKRAADEETRQRKVYAQEQEELRRKPLTGFEAPLDPATNKHHQILDQDGKPLNFETCTLNELETSYAIVNAKASKLREQNKGAEYRRILPQLEALEAAHTFALQQLSDASHKHNVAIATTRAQLYTEVEAYKTSIQEIIKKDAIAAQIRWAEEMAKAKQKLEDLQKNHGSEGAIAEVERQLNEAQNNKLYYEKLEADPTPRARQKDAEKSALKDNEKFGALSPEDRARRLLKTVETNEKIPEETAKKMGQDFRQQLEEEGKQRPFAAITLTREQREQAEGEWRERLETASRRIPALALRDGTPDVPAAELAKIAVERERATNKRFKESSKTSVATEQTSLTTRSETPLSTPRLSTQPQTESSLSTRSLSAASTGTGASTPRADRAADVGEEKEDESVTSGSETTTSQETLLEKPQELTEAQKDLNRQIDNLISRHSKDELSLDLSDAAIKLLAKKAAAVAPGGGNALGLKTKKQWRLLKLGGSTLTGGSKATLAARLQGATNNEARIQLLKQMKQRQPRPAR